MLEYFSSKKYKKSKAGSAGSEGEEVNPEIKITKDVEQKVPISNPRTDTSSTAASKPLDPVLKPDDESFLEHLLSEDGPAPPLPPRPQEWEVDWSSDSEVSSVKEPKKRDVVPRKAATVKESDTAVKKPSRLSILFSRPKKVEEEPKAEVKKGKQTLEETEEEGQADEGKEGSPKPKEDLRPDDNVSEGEAKREKKDLVHVLERLNLSAKNNKVINLSNDSSQLLARFTQVFKDLVNGVPTAYDDLTTLIEDRDGVISRNFEKLPSSLKKLVTRLPDKLTSTLAPEILVAAAEAQGLKTSAEGGIKEAAKKLFLPQNLSQLVTKPGALVGMLRAIVETLKARWPAFMGMNVVWSVALSLLLFLLWYCHKRGRETRLEKEQPEGEPIDGSDRVEELPDDPTLPAPTGRDLIESAKEETGEAAGSSREEATTTKEPINAHV